MKPDRFIFKVKPERIRTIESAALRVPISAYSYNDACAYLPGKVNWPDDWMLDHTDEGEGCEADAKRANEWLDKHCPGHSA